MYKMLLCQVHAISTFISPPHVNIHPSLRNEDHKRLSQERNLLLLRKEKTGPTSAGRLEQSHGQAAPAEQCGFQPCIVCSGPAQPTGYTSYRLGGGKSGRDVSKYELHCVISQN
jgi:hypothetical protein